MTKPGRRPTIYDVARLAGASPSAVSAVLNGSWKRRRISAATAERVARIAEEQGYAPNRQASMLRRERSHVIGMIVPKYDNRYFGAIAEQFEAMARERDLFPVITCTLRDPALEVEAARELLSYQAECLIVTGATDPDRIAELCAAAGVRSLNLDLPGRLAPSVISDNCGAALALTRLLLAATEAAFGASAPLWFVGGRGDHNTAERLRGFRQAHAEAGLAVCDSRVIVPGYSARKAAAALAAADVRPRCGLFVNSTMAMEGVLPWLNASFGAEDFRLACFDWDPFAALVPQNVAMVEQDVPALLETLFRLVDTPKAEGGSVEVPCVIHALR